LLKLGEYTSIDVNCGSLVYCKVEVLSMRIIVVVAIQVPGDMSSPKVDTVLFMALESICVSRRSAKDFSTALPHHMAKLDC
jgi:hypothetical protein